MKAKNLNGKPPGGSRQKLIDILPLSTPLIVQVFPTYACNLKCAYCIFSKEPRERGFISNKVNIEYKTYLKFVKECLDFPDKIRLLRFVGIGEPLLHPKISEMVSITNKHDIAEKIEIITNATLLNQKMSDKLIEAGLNRLVVSLQGITSEQYFKTSGRELNIKNIIEYLTYYYNNKKEDQELYIKIANVSLENKEEKNKFYEMFGDICDGIAIENIVPLHDIEYLNEMDREKELTQFGMPIKNIDICSQNFMHIQINPDGNAVPCYSWEYPVILGNINKERIVDIWNGETLKDFRLNMIINNREGCNVCKRCNMSIYRYHKEDDLDNYKEKLKEIYK